MSYPALTPEVTIKVTNKLLVKHEATIVSKEDSSEMEVIAAFVRKFRGIPINVFMSNYATTLGSNIYLPFDLGDKAQLPLKRQLQVVCHELHHVRQYHHRPLEFVSHYLMNDAARAHYEAQAMQCEMEVEYFLTGKVTHPSIYASRLKAYGCDAEDIRVTTTELTIAKAAIVRGGVYHRVAKDAIAELNRLRGRR